MAYYINNRSNGINLKKLASTDYAVGDFLEFNGLGQVVPATGGTPLVGVCLEEINASSPDYAVTRDMTVLEPLPNDELVIPVSIGTATLAMVGSTFDVDPLVPGSIDVSGAGTDVLVTKFINATTVIGKIVQ
jgi:hypothetical protein